MPPSRPSCLARGRTHGDRGGAGSRAHAHPVMPEQLDEIAPAPAKAEDLPGMRIAPQALLNLESQRVHAAAHVRHPASDPHAHPRRERDHGRSRTRRRRERAAVSIEAETLSRRPLVSMISTLSSTAGVSVAIELAGAGSDPICSGMKAGAPPPGSPSRYSFRHRVSRERESPYRRAVAEPWRWPRKLSSTMRTFSASERSRRRPVSSAERTSKSEMTLGHLDFLPFSCPLGGARGLKQEDERRLSLCCVRMGVALRPSRSDFSASRPDLFCSRDAHAGHGLRRRSWPRRRML